MLFIASFDHGSIYNLNINLDQQDYMKDDFKKLQTDGFIRKSDNVIFFSLKSPPDGAFQLTLPVWPKDLYS